MTTDTIVTLKGSPNKWIVDRIGSGGILELSSLDQFQPQGFMSQPSDKPIRHQMISNVDQIDAYIQRPTADPDILTTGPLRWVWEGGGELTEMLAGQQVVATLAGADLAGLTRDQGIVYQPSANPHPPLVPWSIDSDRQTPVAALGGAQIGRSWLLRANYGSLDTDATLLFVLPGGRVVSPKPIMLTGVEIFKPRVIVGATVKVVLSGGSASAPFGNGLAFYGRADRANPTSFHCWTEIVEPGVVTNEKPPVLTVGADEPLGLFHSGWRYRAHIAVTVDTPVGKATTVSTPSDEFIIP